MVVTPAIAADPSNLSAVIAAAQPGAKIKLAKGDYGTFTIKNRQWSKRITLNCSGARMILVISKSSGILINGGTLGPNKVAPGYAAQVVQSQHIQFQGSVFVDSRKGLILDRCQHIKIDRCRFSKMTVDGVNIALSQFVTVTDCKPELFETGTEHPDFIQGWSRPGGITSDVLVARNKMDMAGAQGICFFNHVRDGVDDGGFDRIRIEDNEIRGSYPQGINLTDARDSAILRNKVTTIPGSKHRTSINVVRGSVRQEGNEVGLKS